MTTLTALPSEILGRVLLILIALFYAFLYLSLSNEGTNRTRSRMWYYAEP